MPFIKDEINIGDDQIGKFSISTGRNFFLMRDIVCKMYRFAHVSQTKGAFLHQQVYFMYFIKRKEKKFEMNAIFYV